MTVSAGAPGVRIAVQVDQIVDWPTFHAVFKRDMRFFDDYGDNMNAWIDCMGDWARPGTPGLMQHEIPEGADLIVVLRDGTDLATRLPEIAQALWACTGAVNQRFAAVQLMRRILLEIA